MARLAIAKGFLSEYAKLEKNVQSAVESAISKFGEHTYAGLHLEKLNHSRDDRIRTIRVDSFWRGVVLAPATGDTYCLITVLPHDKANAYASSHRFSVNQALGVLEVRDEEALQQLQPSLQAVAQADDKRLFAKVSDSDTLTGYRSPMRGRRPLVCAAATREQELTSPAGRPNSLARNPMAGGPRRKPV